MSSAYLDTRSYWTSNQRMLVLEHERWLLLLVAAVGSLSLGCFESLSSQFERLTSFKSAAIETTQVLPSGMALL
jgi:hypothetical protein